MKTLVRAAVMRLKMRKVDVAEADLSPIDYDMKEINQRAHLAMRRTGRTRIEVAELYGMDTDIPIAMQPPERIPRPTMANVVKLAGLLGVSVRWMLYGEPENDVDLFVIGQQQACSPTCGPACMACGERSASQGGAIISGALNSTVVVQNIKGDDLTDLERELLQSIRALSARDQAAVISYVFTLGQENASIENGLPASAGGPKLEQ